MGSADSGFVAYMTAFGEGLEPDPDMWVDEWSDTFMVIPKKSGAAEAGPYRTDRTPAAREIMRALSPAHPARRVVVKAASQVMKTQVGLNWLAACIHQAPANILVLLPTANLAKRVSHRIEETVKAVPELRERVAMARSRDSRNTIDTKEFDGGTLYITTAGSAANLAEIPARYVYGDEVDRWELNLDDEGDPVLLAEARTGTFQYNAKIYFSSSPTLEGQSKIEELFRKGNQAQHQVACPHCGHWHFLDWVKSARWNDALTACWFICPECGAEIYEHEKSKMLPAGRWVAQSDGDGETWSFHYPAQYAPLGWISWLALARQYVEALKAQAQGNPGLMQVFYNTRLAEVFKREGAQLGAEFLRNRKTVRRMKTVPACCFVLTAGVDVQDNRLHVNVWAWGPGEECAIVDRVVIEGDPAQTERQSEDLPTVWERLDALFETRYPHASGNTLGVEAVAIDTGGHCTHSVYAYCRPRATMQVVAAGHIWIRRTFAIKGYERPGMPVKGKSNLVDVNWRGDIVKQGVRLWQAGVGATKDWWFAHLKMAEPGPGYVHLAIDVPAEWYEQMTSEKRVTARTARGFRDVWVRETGKRNEDWDCSGYALFAAHALDLHRYTAAMWGQIKDRVAPLQGDLLSSAPLQLGTDDGVQTSEQIQAPAAAAPAQATRPAPAAPADDWLGPQRENWLD